jgi:hypothetical protein
VKSPSKSRAPYASLREFSEALDTPLSTVSGWTKHPQWQWTARAPWPREVVPQVLRWAATMLEKGRPAKSKTDPAGFSKTVNLRDEKLRQEIRKLRAHADQAESQLARERGALHDAAVCEEEAVRRAVLFRNGVQNIPPQVVSMALSHGLPHDGAPVFQKQIEELVNGCLRYLASTADAEPAAGDEAGVIGADAA